ncbi:MAG: hypothetical protein SFX18_16850 [Pirellulales bacterium]|nr:hypothetical protein [Pirellulales bacterium]
MAVFGVGMFGDWISMIAMYVAFLALPGFIISALAQLLRPSSHARLGIVLGIFGMFFLPTFYLSLRH